MMNKPFLYFGMLLMFVSSISFSQSKAELKELAFQQAKITADATIAGDYKTVIKHTYPTIVTVMGGEENAIALIEDTFKTMGQQGFEFEMAEVVSVSDVIYEQDEYRCYVHNKNQMRMNDMRIFADSYLLGIYNAENKIWYFLEAKQLNNSGMIDQILPNFKTDLQIPDDTTEMKQIKD